MDQGSITALMDICSNLCLLSVSMAGKLDGMQENHFYDQLSFLPGSLRKLAQGASALESCLIKTPTMSSYVHHVLDRFLTSCDGAMTILRNELSRLQSIKVLATLNSEFLTAYGEMLDLSYGLLTYFAEALAGDQQKHDEILKSMQACNLMQQADKSFRAALTHRGITRERRGLNVVGGTISGPQQFQAQGAAGNAAEPAPNTAPGPSTHSDGITGWVTSLHDAFRAFAEGIQERPQLMISSLCEAATVGDLEKVTRLVDCRANVNGRDEFGNMPLQCAILFNHADIAELLLDSGCKTTYPTWHGLPPLFLAASVGSINVAKVLLSKGASIEDKNMSGQSYFVDVVATGRLDGIQFLLESGCSPDTQNSSGEVVMAHAIRKHQFAVVTLLMNFGANVNGTDISGRPLLALALDKKDLMISEILVLTGANPNAKGLQGVPLLVCEIQQRRLEAVKLLLRNGADANAKNSHSVPVIVLALRDHHIPMEEKVDIVRELLESGANADVTDTNYNAPAIRFAVELGVADLVAVLLQHGARAAGVMSTGESMVQYAVNHCRMEIVQLLLDYGADPNFKNHNNITSVMQALMKQDILLLKMLKEAGATTRTTEIKEFARTLGRADILAVLGVGYEVDDLLE